MEPVIALATPPLPSALALIRLSGDGVFALTEQLLGKELGVGDHPKIVHGTLCDGDQPLDDVVLLCYPQGKSMTGEDVVEISCHGSPLIADQIIEAYLSLGVRYAVNGEFTSRAYINGKMDLVQAEAVNDLIRASTIEGKNLAMLSLSGKTSEMFAPLLEEIASILARIEVGIDYPEYDEEEPLTLREVASKCEALLPRLEDMLGKGSDARMIHDGIDVALVGEPNVGKSSLLNALLREDKAIVTSIPGTTRDVVEGTISVHGVPVRLKDTAGIRDTEDEIERLGVERSKKAIEDADIVLLVYDGSRPKEEQCKNPLLSMKTKKIIEVCNKADLISKRIPGICYASSRNGDVDMVKEALFAALSLNEGVYVTPALSSSRQLALLRQIHNALCEALKRIEEEQTLDLVAYDIQEAYNKAREIVGLDASRDYGDEIFSRFCVGK